MNNIEELKRKKELEIEYAIKENEIERKIGSPYVKVEPGNRLGILTGVPIYYLRIVDGHEIEGLRDALLALPQTKEYMVNTHWNEKTPLPYYVHLSDYVHSSTYFGICWISDGIEISTFSIKTPTGDSQLDSLFIRKTRNLASYEIESQRAKMGGRWRKSMVNNHTCITFKGDHVDYQGGSATLTTENAITEFINAIINNK